jgi:DNA-directed RNA polymerase subunit RPC12/RpoP
MVEYKCTKCGKEFQKKWDYEQHCDRKYSCDKEDIIKCEKCGKSFSHSSSMYRHTKGCDGKNIVNIEQQNIEQHNTNVVEGDFNVDGDVKVVKFGEENLSYISDDTFKKIIGRGFKSLEEFMNHVHFNKDHPENHNIYVASMKDGHVITYNGERWDVGLADQVLDDLIQQKSDILEEKYDEIVDKLSPMESKKFNNFMNRKDDEKVNLKLKRELRVQLYNNRHFAKGAKKLLEECERTKSLSDNNSDREKLDTLIQTIKDGDVDTRTINELLNVLNKNLK